MMVMMMRLSLTKHDELVLPVCKPVVQKHSVGLLGSDPTALYLSLFISPSVSEVMWKFSCLSDSRLHPSSSSPCRVLGRSLGNSALK
ncbi:hypothetical protein INR49_006935 [Caranx melampygus]|nr:hypothetical protein INR49_006935 [Caranx melampygus]